MASGGSVVAARLEDILTKGVERFPDFVSQYPSAHQHNRAAILMGGLLFGEALEEPFRGVNLGRDPDAKHRFMAGLGEMGHPDAEGYFGRFLRESSRRDKQPEAVRILGTIKSDKGLELLLSKLEDPELFQQICSVLVGWRDSRIESALIDRWEEEPAFRALASVGYEGCAELFARGVEMGQPFEPLGARGLGLTGDSHWASLLASYIFSSNAETAREAFIGYARLADDQTVAREPLVARMSRSIEDWMLGPISGLDDTRITQLLIEGLKPVKPKSFFRRLFSRAKPAVDGFETEVLAALAAHPGDHGLEAVVPWLTEGSDNRTLRIILDNLAADVDVSLQLTPLWHADDQCLRYWAAKTSLRNPTVEFLIQAMDFTTLGDFIPIDGAPSTIDPGYAMETWARDNNPCILMGGLLDEGWLDLDELVETLRQRFVASDFPVDADPAKRFSGTGWEPTGEFLSIVSEVNPSISHELNKLWDLLETVEEGGDPLLDTFLNYCNVHRGGLKRLIVDEARETMGALVDGRDDTFLPELDRAALRCPKEGKVGKRFGEIFADCRLRLMAECKDMVVCGEGGKRGDMVLIEKLR